MKDKDGFDIRCKHTDWKIIDKRDNKDYVCSLYGNRWDGYHICFCDEHCKSYEPIKEETDDRRTD